MANLAPVEKNGAYFVNLARNAVETKFSVFYSQRMVPEMEDAIGRLETTYTFYYNEIDYEKLLLFLRHKQRLDCSFTQVKEGRKFVVKFDKVFESPRGHDSIDSYLNK
jgi:hypothetical protein